MALVEDDRELAGGLDPLDQAAAVGVQDREQLLVVAGLGDQLAGVAAQPGQVRSVVGVAVRRGRVGAVQARLPLGDLLVQGRVVRVEVADRLVGQGRDRRLQVRAVAGLHGGRLVGPPLLDPLLLDGGVGAERERRVAQPARDLQPDQRLARTGREHQVRPPPAARARLLKSVDRHSLVAPERAWEGDLGEGLRELTGRHRRPDHLAHWGSERRRRRKPGGTGSGRWHLPIFAPAAPPGGDGGRGRHTP